MNIKSTFRNNMFFVAVSNITNEIYYQYIKKLISKELHKKILYNLFNKYTIQPNDNLLQIKRQSIIKHNYKTITKQQKILYKQINKNKYNKMKHFIKN